MFAAKNELFTRPSGGYQISRSLRFNSADSAYLNRTPATTTNRQIWTWSGWVKRGKLGVNGRVFQAREGSTGNQFFLRFSSTDTIFVTGDSGSYTLETTQVFRDPSAWYHIVFACDTTQATSSNRFKLYVNGSQVTAFGTATYPSQNLNTTVNSAFPHGLGAETSGPSEFFDGYITETYLIDGQALTPSSFGETNAQTGVWQPKAYSGSYGTNGFYLNFSDNSNTTAATLGKDYSGNGNNWTPNNFSVTAGAGNDSLVDSPTSYGTDTGVGGTVRGNYATLNPLNAFGTSTFTNGNLDVSVSSLNTNNLATIAIPTSGKWYWEYQITAIGGGGSPMAGVASTSSNSPALFYRSNGDKLVDGTSSSYGATYTTTDIIGVAVNTDSGTITFYKNGSSQGAVTYATSSGSFFPALRSNAATDNFTVNFGQRAFANTAPSGFKALCTQNLPTPTIGATTATQAGKYFNTILWSGNGGGTRSLTGVGFQPSFVWAKTRNSAAQYHTLFDAVRGGNKTLFSNATLAENTNSASGYISSFDSDGFSVIGGNDTNASGSTYVGWNWSGNGTGSTNTAGSITSTVSANTTSGFSVATYTGNGTGGATIGHGLGVAPRMIIIKCRSDASGWAVYQADVGNTKYLRLDGSDAANTASTLWNNTSPTSTVFSVGTDGWVNTSARTYVAYCFAEVAGYSKFGSYTGNGSADGPFIFTGFRPAFVLIKSSTVASASWRLWDAKRSTYNVVNSSLFPNLSNAEVSTADYAIDFLSNGIKIRAADDGQNYSGGTFIYAAFAEAPQKFSLAR
jgi:hypothetical protein